MPTNESDRISVQLRGGGTYTVHRHNAHEVAAGLLRALGASYEISYPDRTAEDRARTAKERSLILTNLREDAEAHATEAAYRVITPLTVPDRVGREVLEELVREALATAYCAGWTASPKRVSSPVR